MKIVMRTTLNSDGQISIPAEIRQADHLAPGDSFEMERLTPGHYILAKQPNSAAHFSISTGSDGLPVIRVENGIITSQTVKDIESRTP